MSLHHGQHHNCTLCDDAARAESRENADRVQRIRAAFPGMDQEVHNRNGVCIGWLLQGSTAVDPCGRLFQVSQDQHQIVNGRQSTAHRTYSIEVPGKDLDHNAYSTVAEAAERASWHDDATLIVWVGDRQVAATAGELSDFARLAERK